MVSTLQVHPRHCTPVCIGPRSMYGTNKDATRAQILEDDSCELGRKLLIQTQTLPHTCTVTTRYVQQVSLVRAPPPQLNFTRSQFIFGREESTELQQDKAMLCNSSMSPRLALSPVQDPLIILDPILEASILLPSATDARNEGARCSCTSPLHTLNPAWLACPGIDRIRTWEPRDMLLGPPTWTAC
jgi:hypothetical protein